MHAIPFFRCIRFSLLPNFIPFRSLALLILNFILVEISICVFDDKVPKFLNGKIRVLFYYSKIKSRSLFPELKYNHRLNRGIISSNRSYFQLLRFIISVWFPRKQKSIFFVFYTSKRNKVFNEFSIASRIFALGNG